MKKVFGVYDCKTGEFINKSNDVNCFEDDELIIILAGKIGNNTKEISSLYNEHGKNLTKFLTGFYIMVIYDKNSKAVCVFQDRTTSPLTFYYTFNAGKVFFGTSIKDLLISSKMERKMNENVLGEFLTNGFIYGRETLLENVYKIESFKGLHIQKNQIDQFPVEYFVKNYSQTEAFGRWRESLTAAIRKCVATKKEINMPLSSGYDSNFIAFVASEYENVHVNAFSVGGKIGKNEVPIVEDNVSAYENITLYSVLTDGRSLNHFPDIVWKLEGAVYESGIFLQYELAKLVSEKKIHDIICGECADQVMNLYYLDDDRINIKKTGEPIYYEFSEYPYIFGSYLILKKNGILANSFGIDTDYPYINDDFVSVAHALRNINQKDKRIHVATCRELLPKKVTKNMSKIGGSTELHSLFENTEESDRFIANVKASEFYKKHKDTFERYSVSLKEKQTGIRLLKTKVRNILMDLLHLNVENRKRDAYYHRELQIRESMLYVYLYLFDKLFLSGEYDDFMDNEELNIELSEMM